MRLCFTLGLMFILSACSTTYIGLKDPWLFEESCSVQASICQVRLKHLDIEYRVQPLANNEYRVSGIVSWKDKVLGNHYDNMDSLRLSMLFLNNSSVVHEEDIYIYGRLRDSLSFEETFISSAEIRQSLALTYFARISE